MQNFRQEFSDFAPTIFLNCAYQGPFPRVAVERIQHAIELKRRPDRLADNEYFQLPDSVRFRIARLTGAQPSEIAITNSAMQGVGIAAAGLKLGEGDEVVVASTNFPSNLFTWLHLRRKGVTVKVINPRAGVITVDDVAAALTDRTRVLALDWVVYTTGARIDLAAFGELIHQRGGIFVVDGTQGVGAIEVDLRQLPVDILACAAYKWLLGPYGTGFAYVAPEILPTLELSMINWYSVEGSSDLDSLPQEDFKLVSDARVFDSGGSGNFLNLHGLDASLEFVESVTVKEVYNHCRALLVHLQEGLHTRGYAMSAASAPGNESTILCFKSATPEATAALHKKLRANNISVSLRHGMVRVSPYLYNDLSDIDRLLEVAGPA
jgi:cysteine desulfurase/selenocysteine lyase